MAPKTAILQTTANGENRPIADTSPLWRSLQACGTISSMIGELLAYGPTYGAIFGASLLLAAGLACSVLVGLGTGRIGPWRFVLRDRYPTAFRLAAVYLVVAIVVLLATPFYIVWKHTGH